MASSSVYVSVIEDVIANVREDFITYGVGDAVLNELQALWQMKMLHISGNMDRNRAAAASAGGAPGAGAAPPVHGLSVPYAATSEEYATPAADVLFPPSPLQPPMPAVETPRPMDHTWDEDDDEPPLNEDDDDDETADFEYYDIDEPNTQHLVIAQFEKVTRTNNRWKCTLKDGIMHLNGRDVLFNKASGEF